MKRHPDPTVQRFSMFLTAFQGTDSVSSDSDGYDFSTQQTIPCSGAARIRGRYKGSVPGTLKMRFVGHDFDPEQPDEPGNGTEFTTGYPTDVVVAADTEAVIEADCYGEPYVRFIFEADEDYEEGSHTYLFASQV
jgi:hypothetical protein